MLHVPDGRCWELGTNAMVDPRGIEPPTLCLQSSVAALEHAGPYKGYKVLKTSEVSGMVLSEGVEPPFPGCKPGVLAVLPTELTGLSRYREMVLPPRVELGPAR